MLPSRRHHPVRQAVAGIAVAMLAAATLDLAAAPDLVLVNAKVFTADAARPYAEALAVETGRIAAVGTTTEIYALAGPITRIVDVGGRLVTPGLIEAHVHLGPRFPTPPLVMPNLPFPGPTAEQVLAAVGEAAKSRTDWVSVPVGPLAARDRRNWRDALDAVAPRTPVFLRGFWGHTTIVNSEALRRLGIGERVSDPLGGWWGRDANGRLDGRAYEAAETVNPSVRPPDARMLAEAYVEASRRYARWGVTSIHLMNNDKSLQVAIAGLALASTGQKWTIYSWATPVQRISDAWTAIAAVGHVPPGVRIEGPKWVLDGTPLEQNARRRQPYPNRPGWFGRSNFSDEQVRAILRDALSSTTQLALHVVGDIETERVLTVMEGLSPPAPWRAKRVRLEHADGLGPRLLERAARLGVVVIQNPTHLPPPPKDGTTGADPLLPLRSLTQAGIPLALGSDGGPDEQNPFLNLMLATLYPAAPGEALTREEALLAYTAGAAYAEREEMRKGRLAPGYAADFAVLSRDVLTIPARDLPGTTSLLTVVDGIVIHESAELHGTR